MLANCNPKRLPVQFPPPPSKPIRTRAGTSATGQTQMAMVISPSSQGLYHWSGGWRVHNKHPNYSHKNPKFRANSTRTVITPPPDCQCTTVTKHPTFYTAMTAFGHIAAPTMTADWKAHLANLPEDIKWVFSQQYPQDWSDTSRNPSAQTPDSSQRWVLQRHPGNGCLDGIHRIHPKNGCLTGFSPPQVMQPPKALTAANYQAYMASSQLLWRLANFTKLIMAQS